MKAIVYDRYGPPEVLHLQEVPTPIPRDNEILIRVHATTVTSGDCRLRSLRVPTGFGLLTRLVFGVSRPKRPILGTEFAGVVESAGRAVTAFRPGDEVFGISGTRMGCYAEYLCVPADGTVAPKPLQMNHGEAAALSFGGTAALDFFRRGKLQPGEQVLIHGASGAVGTAAVQLARHLGAVVTGVCSTVNVELVRSLGASRVIDYTKEDFTRRGETYDVIMDTVGTVPFSMCKKVLHPKGRLLLVLAGLPTMLHGAWVSATGNRTVVAGPAAERPEDVRHLAELARLGHFRPVIDRRYALHQIVEAHRYVDTGRKKGNVIITLNS